jgi:YD repeat-containing protein
MGLGMSMVEPTAARGRRRPWISGLLAAALLGGYAHAQEWTELVSHEDRFATMFPGTPQVRTISWDSEYGAVFPGRVYALDLNGRHYSVTVIDYSNAKAIHESRTNSTEADAPTGYEYWRIDKLASIDYAATQFRRRGGEVTFDAWHHIDRVPGHQMQITNADGSRTYAGIYLHWDHLYIIEATVPKGSPPQGMFQQTLRFIDENGETIRYRWDENDHLIRQTRQP